MKGQPRFPARCARFALPRPWPAVASSATGVYTAAGARAVEARTRSPRTRTALGIYDRARGTSNWDGPSRPSRLGTRCHAGRGEGPGFGRWLLGSTGFQTRWTEAVPAWCRGPFRPFAVPSGIAAAAGPSAPQLSRDRRGLQQHGAASFVSKIGRKSARDG